MDRPLWPGPFVPVGARILTGDAAAPAAPHRAIRGEPSMHPTLAHPPSFPILAQEAEHPADVHNQAQRRYPGDPRDVQPVSHCPFTRVRRGARPVALDHPG